MFISKYVRMSPPPLKKYFQKKGIGGTLKVPGGTLGVPRRYPGNPPPPKKKMYVSFGIGGSNCIGREILCIPCAGFFKLYFSFLIRYKSCIELFLSKILLIGDFGPKY